MITFCLFNFWGLFLLTTPFHISAKSRCDFTRIMSQALVAEVILRNAKRVLDTVSQESRGTHS